jgi:hypothetical protein
MSASSRSWLLLLLVCADERLTGQQLDSEKHGLISTFFAVENAGDE